MTHVLLVEDDDVEAEVARRAFAKTPGWKVTRTATFAEALQATERDRFDVAIVDYLLPDGDGVQLLDRLRARDPALPIVFLTGHGSERIAMDALSHGAADYVVKSEDYDRQLFARVAAVATAWQEARPMVRATASTGGMAPNAAPPLRPSSPHSPPPLGVVLGALVIGECQGAAVFDPSGRAVAAVLPFDLATPQVSDVAVRIQGHVHDALRRVAGVRAVAHALLVDFENRILGITTIPGPAVLVLVFGPRTANAAAMTMLRVAAQRVGEAAK